MTRVLECPCGITLSGADDEELFSMGRDHADGTTDEFIRGHIVQNARDSAVA